MKLKFVLLTAISTAITLTGMSQNEELKIGEKAVDFNLADVDGKMVSLKSYPEAKGYIVIFTCNNCPYAVAYQDRIAALSNQFTPLGFPVIAINTSDEKDEIIQRAKEKGYPFPYLYDETQETTRAYGAARTPHAFVLKKDLTVAYVGAIDNNYKSPEKADQKYLKDAVEALLANKPVKVTNTKAIGCTIKWKNT